MPSKELKFHCSSCDKLLSVSEAYSGITAPCPNCGHPITAPDFTKSSTSKLTPKFKPKPKPTPKPPKKRKSTAKKKAAKPAPTPPEKEEEEIDLDSPSRKEKKTLTEFSILDDNHDTPLDPSSIRSTSDVEKGNRRAVETIRRRNHSRSHSRNQSNASFPRSLYRKTKRYTLFILAVLLLAASVIILKPILTGSKNEALTPNTSSTTGTPLQIAENFLNTRSPYERLRYVRYPDEVITRLGDYPDQALYESPTRLDPLKEKKHGDLRYHTFLARFPQNQTRILYLVDTPSGPKIDWDSYARYGSMTWKEIDSAREPFTATLQVSLQLASVYRGLFSNPKKWECYAVISPDLEKNYYVYVHKEDPMNRTLYDIHKGNKFEQCRAIILVFGEPGTSDQGQLLLERIVTTGWLRE